MKRLTEKKYQELLKSNNIDSLVKAFIYNCNLLGNYSIYSNSKRFIQLENRFYGLRERIELLNTEHKEINLVYYKNHGWVTVGDCLA